MPVVSIIIPVYNAEAYLRRCIDGILAQTFTDFELLLVDDGSTDSCGRICDGYAEKDGRIRVFHQENRGQSAARNTALDFAAGKWLCFIDADDFVHPEMLSVFLQTGCRDPDSIVNCRTTEDDFQTMPSFDNIEGLPAEEKVYETNEEGLLSLIEDPYICWTIWGKLIPTQIVRKIPFEEGRCYEDNAVVLKWLYEAKKVTVIEAALYYYQKNYGGTTKGNWTIKKEKDYIWALQERIFFYISSNMYRLFDKYDSNFLIRGADSFFKYREQEKGYASGLRKQLRKWWRLYSDHAQLNENEKKYLFAVIYPLFESAREWAELHMRKKQ